MKSSFQTAVILFQMLFFSLQAGAGEFACPETHPEYNKVISELQAFKKKLSEELKCQEIAVNFEKLTSLLSEKERGSILSLVSSNEGSSLSAEKAKKIQDYAGAVTEEVGVLVSMIGAAANGELSWGEWWSGTDRCSMEEETQLEGIERLTKAAYEATNLISKVAGPYGVPLQVGVSTVYGVVQGLQNYSKRARNIDFDEFEKRQFFESAVCIMSKFDSDVRKLVNPEAHLRNLRRARGKAMSVVNVVRNECEICDPVLDAESDDEAKAQLQNISATKSHEAFKLTEKAYQSRANVEWLDGEIEKFESIKNFKPSGNQGTAGIGPRELQSLKIEINNYIMKTAAPDFLKWYTTKASISNRQLGRTIGSAMKEMRSEIVERGESFDVSLPQSIEEEFKPEHDSTGRLISYTLASENIKNAYIMQAPEISKLFFMVNNLSKINGFSASYYSWLGEAYDVWKLSDFNIRVVQEYCTFFENSLQYHRVENTCEASKYIWHGLRTGYQSFYLASLINESLIMDRLGPFDFRLDTYYEFISRNKSEKNGVLRIAEEGLDFRSVLEADRERRLIDGRFNPYANEFQTLNWWETTDYFADEFLKEFHQMN